MYIKILVSLGSCYIFDELQHFSIYSKHRIYFQRVIKVTTSYTLLLLNRKTLSDSSSEAILIYSTFIAPRHFHPFSTTSTLSRAHRPLLKKTANLSIPQKYDSIISCRCNPGKKTNQRTITN